MNKLFKYIIALAIISLLVFTLFELLIMPFYVRHGKSKKLVDVTLMDTKSALVMIKSAGFKAVISDTIFTSEVEPNIVLDQHPPAGSIVKKGRTVRLNISDVEKLVFVPYIVGQSQRSANLLLKQVGLKVGAISKAYSSIYPKGVIIGQIPDSSETITRGYSVRVVISNGRSPYDIVVPDLFGLSKDSAEEELLKSGLQIGKIQYKQNVDLIPYTVIDQSIQAGTLLDNSQQVDITVSVLDLQDIFQDVTGD